jgi:TolB-like protein
MLTEHGAKLLDFGLTRMRDAGAAGQTDETVAGTRAGTIVGTVAYMSPEQLTGGPLDQRADVYAFGVTLFEMCTGRRPFTGGNEAELIVAILRDAPPSASSMPGIPPGVAAVIDRCLEREPARRFASAEGVMIELARDGILTERAPASPGEPPVVAAARIPTVGVVDFRNITGDPAFDWLSTGIAETVTVDLSKLSTLAVVSRDRIVAAFGASQHHDRQPGEVIEIGHRAGLDFVVTGGYQTLGRALRLTASLVEVKRGEVAGSVKVDGGLDEIFQLQDRLISGLIRAAHAEANEPTNARLARPGNPGMEAYELFARGRRLVQQMGPAGLSEARVLLEQATAADPSYPMAYAALGSAWAMRFISTSNRADLDVAATYLTRAIELDPHLAEPHAWLTYCRGRQQRFADARAAGRRAVDLDPHGFYGPYFFGAALWMEGNEAFRPGVWAEAVDALRRARTNLPRGITALTLLGDVLLRCGRYEDACAAARRAAEIDESGRVEGPRMPGAHTLLGLALARLGRAAESSLALAVAVERLATHDHVYTPAFRAITSIGLAENALRQGETDEAYARYREAIDTCGQHARAIGMGWIAARARLGVAAAAHALIIPREPDERLGEALALLRDRDGFDFSTVFQGGPAIAWMDAARCFARLGRDHDAFEAFVRAVDAGWSDPVALDVRDGLEALRSRPAFFRLIQVVAERAALPDEAGAIGPS